jgi:hypothetical protein
MFAAAMHEEPYVAPGMAWIVPQSRANLKKNDTLLI